MNRRSFLLGLSTIPVAGIAVTSPIVVKEKEFIATQTIRIATPDVVMGIDGGGSDVCCAYVSVNKRDGMSPLSNRRMLKWEI